MHDLKADRSSAITSPNLTLENILNLWRGSGLALLLLSLIFFITTATHAKEKLRSDINLQNFELVFDEEFDDIDVSAWGPNTRWIAHTPWGGDIGAAIFTDPRPNFPFKATDGILAIEARKDTRGRWRSGLLASVDKNTKGFTQQYGYFEIRTKLPKGKGLWPAFWMVGANPKDNGSAEIDVFEHYGPYPDRFKSSVHVHRAKPGNKKQNKFHITRVQPDSLYDRFNTFGVLLDSDSISFYLNRKIIWRTPTPEELRQPLIVLLNLGMGKELQIDEAPEQSFMLVDYVKVWAPKNPDVFGSR